LYAQFNQNLHESAVLALLASCCDSAAVLITFEQGMLPFSAESTDHITFENIILFSR
jgi:hypothetical protein